MSWIHSNQPERKLTSESSPHIRVTRSPMLWSVFAAALAAGAVWMWHHTVRSAGVVHAQACNVTSLAGNFGYNVGGEFFDSAGVEYSSTAGVLFADGRGNVLGKETDSFSGDVFQAETYTGTYTVNADCTGSVVFNYNDPNFFPTNYDFAITGGGNSIQLVESDVGTNAFGTATRQ